MERGVTSKVILETALLTDEEKVTACTLAKAAGADFVKTSTGFGPGGATTADVALMRRVVGEQSRIVRDDRFSGGSGAVGGRVAAVWGSGDERWWPVPSAYRAVCAA